MDNIQQIDFNINEAYEDNYTPPIQSADTLFHFVERLEYLLPIIERLALVPRYCTEDTAYLKIGIRQIAYPMLCFCDINLHKMQEHIRFYGGNGYGIAFAKKWGIRNSIQPIQYITPSSPLINDFTEAFKFSLSSDTNDAAQNFLLTQMLYLKPIQGTMDRNNTSVLKNFTDECEWRFIPDLRSTDFPRVIHEKDLFSKQTWNKALETDNKCWLKFQPDDIKYIILKSRDDFDMLIDLLNSKNLEQNIVNTLISKTIIWQETKGDF